MKNITEYNEFRNNRPTEMIKEGAQLFDQDWKVRTRVSIPVSLINAFIKKVQNETGEDPKKKWSEQEIAEEICNYVTTAFMTVENLPTSIITSGEKEPVVQSQEDMNAQTQVQPAAQPVQEPVQEPAAQTPAEETAQEVPQTQETPAPAAQTPPVQETKPVAQEI